MSKVIIALDRTKRAQQLAAGVHVLRHPNAGEAVTGPEFAGVFDAYAGEGRTDRAIFIPDSLSDIERADIGIHIVASPGLGNTTNDLPNVERWEIFVALDATEWRLDALVFDTLPSIGSLNVVQVGATHADIIADLVTGSASGDRGGPADVSTTLSGTSDPAQIGETLTGAEVTFVSPGAATETRSIAINLPVEAIEINLTQQPNAGSLTQFTVGTLTVSQIIAAMDVGQFTPVSVEVSAAVPVAGNTSIDLIYSADGAQDVTVTVSFGFAVLSPNALSAITLPASTVAEDIAQGAIISGLGESADGSALTLLDDLGGRLALDGTNLVRGALALDYADAQSLSFTIREILGDQQRDTDLTLSVTEVVVTPPAGNLRAQIDALAVDGATGRKSTAALKVVGVDALPSGVSVSGSTIEITADNTLLQDWNLEDYRVEVRNANNVSIVDNLMGDPSGFMGRGEYTLNLFNTDGLLVFNNTFTGSGRPTLSGAHVNMVSDSRNWSITRNKFLAYPQDCLKLGGVNGLFSENYLSGRNRPVGTPDWDAGSYYPEGSYLMFENNIFEKLTTAPAGTQPVEDTTTADFFYHNPHTDDITLPDGINITIRNNYFAAVPDAIVGATQQIRVTRNTGTSNEITNIRIEANMFEQWNGFYPLAVGFIRPHFSTVVYDEGGYAQDGGKSWISLQDGNQDNLPSTSPLWWEETHDINAPGPVLIAHNFVGGGRNGADFRLDRDYGSIVWSNNSDLQGNTRLAPPGSVVENLNEPTFGSGVDYTVPTVYGPDTSFNITPISHGIYRLGSTNVTCVALRSGSDIVGYITPNGTAVSTYTGFTIVPNAGTFTGSFDDGSTFTLTIATGAATVVGAQPVVDESPIGIGWTGQSNLKYLSLNTVFYNNPDVVAPPIPNENLSFIGIARAGDPPTEVAITSQAATDRDVNIALVMFSLFLHHIRPGQQFFFRDLAKSGEGRRHLQTDSETSFDWDTEFQSVIDFREDFYGPLKALIEFWYASDGGTVGNALAEYAPYYMRQDKDGNEFTLGTTNQDSLAPLGTVDHCLYDLNVPAGQKGQGAFAVGETTWTYVQNHFKDSRIERENGMLELYNDPRVQQFASPRGSFGGLYQHDGSHAITDHYDGQGKFAEAMFPALALSLGVDMDIPKFSDTATYATDGSYVDIAISPANGGFLTTTHDFENRDEPTNPLDCDQEVFGAEIRRVGTDDDERQPVFNLAATSRPSQYRGTVVVHDAANRIIRITPEVPFAEGDDARMAWQEDVSPKMDWESGMTGTKDSPQSSGSKIWTKYPIITAPAFENYNSMYKYPGVPVLAFGPVYTCPELSGEAPAPDTTAPEVTNTSTTPNGSFKGAVNEPSQLYMVKLPAGSAQPSADQIRNGEDANGGNAIESRLNAVSGDFTVQFTGDAGTTYVIAYVAQDGATPPNETLGIINMTFADAPSETTPMTNTVSNNEATWDGDPVNSNTINNNEAEYN